MQAQEHHWETSWSPIVIAVGLLFSLPLAFASYFQYGSVGMATACLGIGIPVLLAGISGWINEGIGATEWQFGYSKIGLPIFITSEVLIFLGLFASYWGLRLLSDTWPPTGTPHINLFVPILMTIILVSSSVTIHFAEEKLEADDTGGFRTWLMATIGLGVIFLCFTGYEYNHLLHEGFGTSTNIYSSAFYTITGFHAAHVFLGVSVFIAILIPALSGRVNGTFVKCASVYWHFVDIIWFFVVTQIYFW